MASQGCEQGGKENREVQDNRMQLADQLLRQKAGRKPTQTGVAGAQLGRKEPIDRELPPPRQTASTEEPIRIQQRIYIQQEDRVLQCNPLGSPSLLEGVCLSLNKLRFRLTLSVNSFFDFVRQRTQTEHCILVSVSLFPEYTAINEHGMIIKLR